MNGLSPVIEAHEFTDMDFVAGHPVLDFVNTVTGRNAVPRDWLADDAALARWAMAARLVCEEIPARRRDGDERRGPELSYAKTLREALYAIFQSIAAGRPPPAEGVATLDRYWKAAVARGRLQRLERAISLTPGAGAGTQTLVDHLTLQAVDLLRGDLLGPLKMCDGPNCGWVFLNSSKAGRRRWCDMRTCGNDAKARNFRARRR